MRRLALPLIALAVLAPPALAQSRSVEQRQVLTDLARVLGESHALRQACEGPEDQYWRARMLRLAEVEAPGPTMEARMQAAFNAGFEAAHAAFARCGPSSRAAEAAAAERGRALAGTLAQAMRPAEPPRFPEMTEPEVDLTPLFPELAPAD